MTYTPIPFGTQDWNVPLDAELTALDNQVATNTGNITTLNSTVSSLQSQITTNLDSLVYLVDNHGAVGNGTTNDAPAIQTLINSVPKGATIQFGPKRYGLSSTLTLPPYIRLEGPLADRDSNSADLYPALVPLAGFSSAAVITMVDQATGGYSTVTRDITLRNLNIDGSNLTSETVAGVKATGLVHSTQMYNVSIAAMTDHAITQASNGSGNPYSWRLENVQLFGTGSVTTWNGFDFIGTDHQLTNCRTLNIRGYGYKFNGGANNQLVGCRAEWSALSGFYLTGSWGTVQGSGGCIMTGCSTDRNSQYGVLIDSTGNASHLISGLMLRRDGRNGFPGTGGGGFAGLRISSAATPVIVSGITCYPGVNDDGTGVNSPERGISVANSTYVSIENGYLHADTLPWHDGAGNTALYRGVAVGTATGTTSAPTRSISGANSLPGPLTLVQGGYTAVRGANTNTLLDGRITSDTQARLNVNANGDMLWGSGSATGDYMLARTQATNTGKVTSITRLYDQQADSGPASQGFITWDYDTELISGSGNILTSGTIYLHKVYLPANQAINNLAIGVQTAGSTLTAGQSLMGIYNSGGTRQAITADQSGSWTSTGFKTVALTGTFTPTTAGFYYIAVLSVGTTPPTFYSTNAPSTLFNGNTTGATLRHATNLTSQTTLPSSLTLSSNASTGANTWLAAL